MPVKLSPMMVSMPQYRVTYARPTMKLIANSDGIICTHCRLEQTHNLSERQSREQCRDEPRNENDRAGNADEVQIDRRIFRRRFAVRSEAFSARRCAGTASAFSAHRSSDTWLIDGRPVTKIKTEATMKGDQPFNTCAAECLFAANDQFATDGNHLRGFQNFRNAIVTSSEKTAATTSTRPMS